MAQNLQDEVILLESQIREIYGRVVWTHKTHEKCADIIIKRHERIKITSIILSALTTGGVLVAVLADQKVVGVLSALASGVLFGINAYTKDYNLGELAQKHSQAAVELWQLREEYLSLLTDIKAQHFTVEQIVIKREIFQERLFNIYKGIPRTINKAYKIASNSLMKMEEMTFSDSEIDKLLPKDLRRNN